MSEKIPGSGDKKQVTKIKSLDQLGQHLAGSAEEIVGPEQRAENMQLSPDLEEVHTDFAKGVKELQKESLSDFSKRGKATTHAKDSDRVLLDQGADITYIGNKGGSKNEAFYEKRKRAFGQESKPPTSPDPTFDAKEVMQNMAKVDAANDPHPETRTEQEAKLKALYELKAKYGLQPSSSPYAREWSYEIPTIEKSQIVPEQTETAIEEPAASMSEVAAETAPSVQEQAVKETGPIVMLNPVLSKQAGLKKLTPFSFGDTTPLPPKVAALMEQEQGRMKADKRNKKIGRGLWGALGLGGGLAALLALTHPGEGAKQVHAKAPEKAAATSPSVARGPEARNSTDTPPTVMVPHKGIEVSIDTAGEGADKLYTNLVAKLRVEYPNQAMAPALVQKLMSYPDADAFSREMGFEKLPKSAVMHMQKNPFSADTFKVSADGNTLAYVDSQNVPHVLLNVNSQGTVITHAVENAPMRDYSKESRMNQKIVSLKSQLEAVKAQSASASAPATESEPAPQTPPSSAPGGVQTLEEYNSSHSAS